jgi:hypothetical protein
MADNGNGWQKPAVAGLWAVVLLFAGWMWTTNASAIKDAADRNDQLAAIVRQSQERIATLEEAARNTRETLKRSRTA